jgi:hypothetical protein
MNRRPTRRRLQPFHLGDTRASRRTQWSLALVFATIFAPAAGRVARAECVPFGLPPAISTSLPGA